MTYTWSIKAIKHWQDGTWDALLHIENTNGWRGFERAISTDGFHWRFKSGGEVNKDLQQLLTESMGDMLTHGMRYVVF